ncbi:hypothetical protein FRC11_008370, partial [Ceratobasidium sp. 423]
MGTSIDLQYTSLLLEYQPDSFNTRHMVVNIAQTQKCREKRLADINNPNTDDLIGDGVHEVTPEREYELFDLQDIEMSNPLPVPPDATPGQQKTWLPGPDKYNYHMLSPEPEPGTGRPTAASALRYDQKQGVWVEDYPVPTVGMPIRWATEEEMAKCVLKELGDIGALSDLDNFEIAEFTVQSGLSGQMAWSSNFKMMQDIDKLPHNEDWGHKYYELEGSKGVDTKVLTYRNTENVFRELFAILSLKDHYHYWPEHHYTTPMKEDSVYGNVWSAKAWENTQHQIDDEYMTVGQYIIASDAMPLTGYNGNKKAHPVYFTIGNLPKDICHMHSHCAMVLIRYLPVPKLDCEPNVDKAQELKYKLFNDCMCDLLAPLTAAERTGIEVVCADGGVRHIYPTLSSTIADFPKQCSNSCTIGSFCPVCLVNLDKQGDLDQDVLLWQKDTTLNAIKEQCKEGSPDFEDFGLHDRWPWWNQHTYLDIATLHTPDLLHQIHKGVFKDHLAKWLQKILVMPEHHGIRHFKRGITKFTRSTGREEKEMMKVFLPPVADAAPRVVDAAHALLKFLYLAHSSSLTESELREMDRQLAIFHENKGVFTQWLKSERKFHNIPKIHMLQHYTHTIRMLSTPNGYNTEAPERLHINLTKAGYHASNKVDNTELDQMAKYVQQMDALAIHQAYLTYLAQAEEDDGNSDDGSDTGSDEDQQEDMANGCEVERVVNTEPERRSQIGGPSNLSSAAPVSTNSLSCPIHYPNPDIVTSKNCTKSVTAEYLSAVHGATNLINDISTFLKKFDPTLPKLTISQDSQLDIWTVAHLYHTRLPFKRMEPPKVDHVWAYPPRLNHVQCVGQIGHYDTVLVLSYPNKTGIH